MTGQRRVASIAGSATTGAARKQVERQRQDRLALLEREDWTLVHDGTADTFTDNNSSAFSGKVRSAYSRPVQALHNHEGMSWSRGTRAGCTVPPPRELEDWIGLQEATRSKVVTV